MSLKAPFPYFGGKSRIVHKFWRRVGDVRNFVDPFCGSCASILGRPQPVVGTETVNDANAWLTNAWRSLQFAPDLTAEFCSWPVSELDLHARGDAIFYRQPEIRTLGDALKLCPQCTFRDACPMREGSPESFIEWERANATNHCPAAGGVWILGACAWIGDNWSYSSGSAKRDENGEPIAVTHARPHLGNAGRGVNRQRPHLGDAGRGVNRQRPQDMTRGDAIHLYFQQLAERLRDVRVCCGDWQRVLGETPTTKQGLTAVFLDPPYGATDRDHVYGDEDSYTVAADVRAWCHEHGADPLLRIALFGYEGEGHETLEADGWDVLAWKTQGGYSSQNSMGNENRHRERIWFSPHCVKQDTKSQMVLL